MLKYCSILFVLFAYQTADAQQAVVSWVKEKAIHIKWFPNNFEQTKSILVHGSSIQRVELQENQNAEDANYDLAQRFEVLPAKNRYALLRESDSTEDKHKVLLEPFFENRTQAPSVRNFAFGLFLIANASDSLFHAVCNNWFIDSSAVMGKKYGYRIVTKNTAPWYTTVDTKEPTKYPSPEFTLNLDQKKIVDVNWTSKAYEKFLFAWDIEFSLDQPDSGIVLNTDPYIPFTSTHQKPNTPDLWRHSETNQGHWHFYRLVGYNHFGAPVAFSEWQKIYVPKLINAWVAIDTVYAEAENRVVHVAVHDAVHPTHIEAFRLLRSKYRDSAYLEVARRESISDTVRFSLPNYTTGDAYYYLVEALGANDTARSLPYYFFTLDQEPPDAPDALQGSIDSLGVVSLHWLPPKADDVMGYRVFRSNTKPAEFIEITKELSPALHISDTLRLDNLSPAVYYYVQAVDHNYNNSPPSDTLKLLKPDTLAPIAAVIQSIVVDSAQLLMRWIASPSPDRARYVICRSCPQRDTLLVSQDFELRQLHFSSEPGVGCSYTITVVDSSGNSSTSLPYVYTYEPGFRNAITNLQAHVDRVNKQITLTWQAPQSTVYHYEIYRATAGNKPKLYATLGDAQATSFIDRDLKANNQYVYVVKYVSSTGVHSLVVELVVVY